MVDGFAKLADEWPAMVEVLNRAGQPWPEAAIHADWAWWQRRRARGEIQKLPGRPSLARRWRWKAHRVARFLGGMMALSAMAMQSVGEWPVPSDGPGVQRSPLGSAGGPTQVQLPFEGSALPTVGALAGGPPRMDGALAARWTPASSPAAVDPQRLDSDSAARATVTHRNPESSTPNSDSGAAARQQRFDTESAAVQQQADSAATAVQQRADSDPTARAEISPRDVRSSVSKSDRVSAAGQQQLSSSPTAPRQPGGSGPSAADREMTEPRTTIENQSSISLPEISRKIVGGPQQEAIPSTEVEILPSSYSSRSLSLPRERSSEERMPEIPANPPIPPLQEMLRIARRWSGDVAPKGRQWRLDPLEDSRWFLLEIMPMPEAATLDLVDALKDWDNYLERIARSPRSPDIKLFPKNWKSALRKQILLKAEYVARQEKGRKESAHPTSNEPSAPTTRAPEQVQRHSVFSSRSRPELGRPLTLQPMNLATPFTDDEWARGPEYIVELLKREAQAAREGSQHGRTNRH